MSDWRMSTPKRLVSGIGSVDQLPLLLHEMHLRRPFVVIDPIVEKTAFGLKVLSLMETSKNQRFVDFVTNPTFVHVEKALQAFIEFGCDSIVSIGGGSAIDLAKVVGLVAANGGQVEDYFHGKKTEIRPVPLIAIPTTCGTGAESSPFAVIMDPLIPKKRGVENPFLMPTTVILDPESLSTLSRVMVAATGMDVFAHVLESHLSKKATVLTRLVSRGLLYSIRSSLEKAIFNREIHALEVMLNIAFTARLLYPRTGLTIAHALSHPLGAHTNIHHGLAVVVFLQSSLEFNLPACKALLLDIEATLGLGREGLSLFSWLEAIVSNSGMKDMIVSALANQNLQIERIASEAQESSNIPSNPREIQSNDICDIIRSSLLRFTNG
ncbi:MAG: iron-containing alcohol dehydrogenase [Deltaproteobacteria bacterium]|nr:iron-containing alcohol dehydrogenase [Deltaproteobacteria bacterium]